MGKISDYDKWLYDQVDRYMEEQDKMTCGNCTHYINGFCWKDINNMDQSLLDKERDTRAEDDYCEDWEYNEMEE